MEYEKQIQIGGKKVDQPRAILYYDDGCYLCRNLAMMVHRIMREKLKLAKIREHPAHFADSAISLRLDINGDVLEGAQAWQWLIEQNSEVLGLRWLAVDLGLAASTAGMVNASGQLARKILANRRCLWCKPW